MNVRGMSTKSVRLLAPLVAVVFGASLTMHFVHQNEQAAKEEAKIHDAFDQGRIFYQRWSVKSEEWKRGFNAASQPCIDLYTGPPAQKSDGSLDPAYVVFEKSDLLDGCSNGNWDTWLTSHMDSREQIAYELGKRGLAR